MIVVYIEDGTFGPNDDKESKLQTFLEDVNLTKGGEIERLNLNRNNPNQAFIYFKEKKVAERVAKQSIIRIAAYKFNVKLNNRRASQSEENKIRDPYEEFNTDDDSEKGAAAVAPKKQQPIQKKLAKHYSSFSDLSSKKPSLHLNRRPIIIDGNNVGMRLLTISIFMYNSICTV